MKLFNFIFALLVGALRWFVLLKLWGWFISPVFGLITPTFWQMAGISFTVSLFTAHISWSDMEKHDDAEIAARSFYALVVVLMFWGLGYTIKLIGG